MIYDIVMLYLSMTFARQSLAHFNPRIEMACGLWFSGWNNQVSYAGKNTNPPVLFRRRSPKRRVLAKPVDIWWNNRQLLVSFEHIRIHPSYILVLYQYPTNIQPYPTIYCLLKNSTCFYHVFSFDHQVEVKQLPAPPPKAVWLGFGCAVWCFFRYQKCVFFFFFFFFFFFDLNWSFGLLTPGV